MASHCGARWESELEQDFVRLDVMLDKSFLSCDFEYLVNLQYSLSFDVDRSSFLVNLVVVVRVHVDDVVDLIEIITINDIVHIVFLSPVQEGSEHEDGLLHIEFSSS